MPRDAALPQLDADLFLTDGGIETTLIFDDGFDLPEFAAFVLLDDERGRAALERYFDAYRSIAARDGVGIVLETPTWRASTGWMEKLDRSPGDVAAVNRDAVALVAEARERHGSATVPVVISGCVGPQGDGYRPAELLSTEEARRYHAPQVEAFAGSPADLVTAITMTYPEEATGVALAARDAGMPVVISFTTETDGALPNGVALRDAIERVDAATDAAPVYYMINCAHPTHFAHVLEAGTEWTQRIRGVRANASKLSHAELDEAEELDAGDPLELAQDYRALRATHDHLTVLGGCCGTSDRHIAAISAACRDTGG
jgi:homocysteine S-methyltransferase